MLGLAVWLRAPNTYYLTATSLSLSLFLSLSLSLSVYIYGRWSQWLRVLRRRPTAARQLRSWVRIQMGAWMFVCCVLSATSWSLAQRSPTDCGASFCVITQPRERGGHSPRWAAEPEKIIIMIITIIYKVSHDSLLHYQKRRIYLVISLSYSHFLIFDVKYGAHFRKVGQLLSELLRASLNKPTINIRYQVHTKI
jgi:hypothetical protein